MTRIEATRSLQARIRSSKGADRKLDYRIANWRGWRSDGNYNYTPSGAMTLEEPPRYTASLDAGLALLNAVLPSSHWSRTPDGTFRAFNSGRTYEAKPLATDCHTFLDAIFSAAIAELEAQPDEHRRYDPLSHDYDNEIVE